MRSMGRPDASGGRGQGVFLELKPGIYRLRATAVPTGSNAIDEMKAILLIQ